MSNLNILPPPPTVLEPPPPTTPNTQPTSRAPVKGIGVDSNTGLTARKMYTQEVRKAKKGSLLMRRRIGIKETGGMGGDEDDAGGEMSGAGTSVSSSSNVTMETDHYYGSASSASEPVKKKGIDWHLRLTQAFTAYLTPHDASGLDKMNKRLVHRKLDVAIMEVSHGGAGWVGGGGGGGDAASHRIALGWIGLGVAMDKELQASEFDNGDDVQPTRLRRRTTWL